MKLSDSYWPLLLATITTYISFFYEPIKQAYIELGFLRGYLVIGILFISSFAWYVVSSTLESLLMPYFCEKGDNE